MCTSKSTLSIGNSNISVVPYQRRRRRRRDDNDEKDNQPTDG